MSDRVQIGDIYQLLSRDKVDSMFNGLYLVYDTYKRIDESKSPGFSVFSLNGLGYGWETEENLLDDTLYRKVA